MQAFEAYARTAYLPALGYPPPPALNFGPPEFDLGREVLYLLLEAWNTLAWEIRQQMAAPLPTIRLPYQNYTPGRHHLAADIKPPRPANRPDLESIMLDELWVRRLHEIAERRAPRVRS